MTYRSRRAVFLILLAACLFALPEAFPQNQAVLPEIVSKRLLNDLQVIVASGQQLGEGMTIGLVLRYGSAYDPSDKGGLANLLARLIGKATQDRTTQDIQDEMAYLGASLEVECSWDGIHFLLRAPASRFERALLLLYQMVGEAVLVEDDFVKAKAELLQEIEKPKDPRQLVRSQIESTLFRGTTYGRPLRGSRQSLQNITSGDIRLFYRRFFSPGAASLVVAGSVQATQVLQKATRIWGVWVKRDDVPFTFFPPREPAARNIFFIDDPSSTAAQFVLSSLWPRRDDPSYYPGVLAARVLQERLTKTLPTSLVTVGVEGRRLPGIFWIQGQAAADQALEEIGKIMDAAEFLKTQPVAAEELAHVQNDWVADYNASLTTPDGVCRSIMESELYRLGTNYASSFPELVRRSGTDIVSQTAKEWIFPGGVVILVRGPASALKEGLEKLGTIQKINP